ncbi:hypothetical protein VFPPC_16610 [Pochonia chlamydosporia 170]|uniref:Uncharacterized protein n=1 Tax=Pochonia chlamydosporia 170 TaxID=1380566 RepID=A0A179F9B8_METCM|nr:hypothetical protein VFPPC_16610 [Pochonia chlamydosporia 170]OAQ62115.1 hypothetical protein VFPPC_16610 [Pochonia chlamydosporia 170]
MVRNMCKWRPVFPQFPTLVQQPCKALTENVMDGSCLLTALGFLGQFCQGLGNDSI